MMQVKLPSVCGIIRDTHDRLLFQLLKQIQLEISKLKFDMT